MLLGNGMRLLCCCSPAVGYRIQRRASIDWLSVGGPVREL